MAKKKVKMAKKKVSITKKMVEVLIDKKFDEVNNRIDRILAALSKAKSVKGL